MEDKSFLVFHLINGDAVFAIYVPRLTLHA
jgi:hypothetical protein